MSPYVESPVPLQYKTSRVAHSASYATFDMNAMSLHCNKRLDVLSGSGTKLSA